MSNTASGAGALFASLCPGAELDPPITYKGVFETAAREALKTGDEGQMSKLDRLQVLGVSGAVSRPSLMCVPALFFFFFHKTEDESKIKNRWKVKLEMKWMLLVFWGTFFAVFWLLSHKTYVKILYIL